MYMQVLIIGNGFDLNLGLPTRYGDFIKSNQFSKLVEHENKFANYLKEKYEDQRWVDIENELKAYSLKVAANFEIEYNQVVISLIEYLNSIDYSQLNNNSIGYKIISELKKDQFKVVNFNYTNTVKNILMLNEFTSDEAAEHIIHVHGSLDENSIIFGIEDIAKIDRQHIFLKKAYNPSFKSVDINSLLSSANSVTFFGHSLGNTDHSYFELFIGLQSSSQNDINKTITFYYYGDKNYKALFQELDILSNNQLTALRQTNNFSTINTLNT